MNSNILAYQSRRLRLQEIEMSRGRSLCPSCLQPAFGCYCRGLRPVDPRIRFIVLIHPLEARRRIATGRMSHLCLSNSLLIRGEDYTGNRAIDAVVSDPGVHSVVLYPGPTSLDLSRIPADARTALFPADKKLAVFVIDGTWWTARKIVRSANIAGLPRVCFTPRTPSRFRVRKQPSAGCWSTIEAIHEAIELLGPGQGFDVASRAHDVLLDTFDAMVERQLACIQSMRASRHGSEAGR